LSDSDVEKTRSKSVSFGLGMTFFTARGAKVLSAKDNSATIVPGRRTTKTRLNI
jgi:hypothetical protein